MLRVVLATALISVFASAAPAFAAEPAATPSPAPAEQAQPAPASKGKPAKDPKDPNRLVCTRERIVGSNRPEKVCMTAARRDELRAAAQQVMDPTRSAVGSSGGATGAGPQ